MEPVDKFNDALPARLVWSRAVEKGCLPMPGEQRASDAEREDVVALLTRALSEGRITPVEFHERVDAAYAARTRADLDALTTDLPHSIW